MSPATPPDDAARLRKANLRTAAILFSVALVFFGGIITARYLGAVTDGITAVGAAVFVFLIVAIGRNLRGRK